MVPKIRIVYRNKPHDIRVVSHHIYPLTKNILQLYVDFNVRGMEVNSWGSSFKKDSDAVSIFFEDGKDIRVEVQIDAGFEIGCMPGHFSKSSYRAIIVSRKWEIKKWEEYCRRKG
jgi:hypothetical protein